MSHRCGAVIEKFFIADALHEVFMLSKAGKQSFDRLRVIFPGNIKNHALKSPVTYACKMHDLTNKKVCRYELSELSYLGMNSLHENACQHSEFEFPERSKRMTLLLVDNMG